MKKKAQEQQQQDPRINQVSQMQEQINVNQDNPMTSVRQIVTSIDLLMADPNYGPQNQALLSVMKNKYETLHEQLEDGILKEANFFRDEFVKTAQKVQMPPTPSPDHENATLTYNRMKELMETLKGQLNSQIQRYNQIGPIVEQASAQKADWAAKYMPQAQAWRNTKNTAWELELTNKRASHKQAYPISPQWKPAKEKPDLEKWKKTAQKMQAFARVYGENYTLPQILYHFTKDWNMFDRYDFKKWYMWNNRTASSDKLKKYAFGDSVGQDRMSQFTKKRKRLMSRIALVRKALMELINDGLIQQQASDKIYKLISMMEFESMRLQVPKMASARLRRTAKQMQKLGFNSGSKIVLEAADELLNAPLVKTAKEEKNQAVGLLKRIKSEMDALSYSRHLDELFYIKKELEKMGRAGDAESIEKIIRDDLSVLEKLNKKLTEVYTNLSKVPLELSEEEDKFLPEEKAKERVEEMPLEVTEDEAMKPKRPTPPRERREAPRRPTPTLETEIPNV